MTIAEEVAELAKETRMNAINLAVAAAKVKLANPSFRNTNERIIKLVTRATEAASGVDRLTRQLSGEPQGDNKVEPDRGSLDRLEDCVREVEEVSEQIISEIRALSAACQTEGERSSSQGI